LPHAVLFFIAPPFWLADGRDGVGRPASGNAGLTASRRGCRSDLETRPRCCVHGATLPRGAEELL